MEYSWSKGLKYGLLVWLIIFAVVSALVGFKVYDNIWCKALIVVICAVVSFLFIRSAKPANLAAGFYYGLTWVVVAAILDFLISARFNPAIFSSKSLWAGYLVIFLIASFGHSLTKQPDEPIHPTQGM